MGFFMSDINFCNTKEQLNHLGEVVTGKVDGSPTGADIDTSTLPYTGQVRKTLPALEAEYEQSITDKEAEADAAIDEYRLTNKGDYAAGITLENKFEFITYNGESYFATNPPYTTTATTPDNDTGNLFIGGYVSQTQAESIASDVLSDEVSAYTDIVYKASGGNSAVDNMLNESPLASAIGEAIRTNGTLFAKDSAGTPLTLDNFRAFNAIDISAFLTSFDGTLDSTDKVQEAIDGAAGSTAVIFNTTLRIDGSLVIPKGVTLALVNSSFDLIGDIEINGRIESERVRIFNYTGNIEDHVKGFCDNDVIYPEWFGGEQSPDDAPIDCTDGFNDALRYAYESKVYNVLMKGGASKNFPSGPRYYVTSINVPARVWLRGESRDETFIKQIDGTENLPVVTDWSVTGADRVKLGQFQIDCNDNTGSSGVMLGFNPAFVWGIEGWAADLRIRNFDAYGFIARSSVTQIFRLTCDSSSNNSVGLRMEGGSTFVYTYITNNVGASVEFLGSGHKIYGFHTESNNINYLVKWRTGAVGCSIIGSAFVRNSNNPVEGLFVFEENTIRNGFYDFYQTGNNDGSVPTVSDEEYRVYDNVGDVTDYKQGGSQTPIGIIDDGDTTSEQIRIKPSNSTYTYVGTNTLAYFRLPAHNTRSISQEITLFNATSFDIEARPDETDIGESIFYGLTETAKIPARTSVTFRYVDDMIVYSPYIP
ncbi:coil containing protein [Vibrio phage 1.197.A._10N.286.54.F2]|nr:coil containing protein [Vibrio phage 1.197.A._10N.286.54.F2]